MRHVLFFDGTRNDHASETNVHRLWQLVASRGADGVVQTRTYAEGVGVRPLEQVRGGAFGRYLSRNIREAYHCLACHHHEGDELFVFGFSRGAFTAMGLVGLLAWRGLPRTDAAGGQGRAERWRQQIAEQFAVYQTATQRSREHGRPGAMALVELERLSPDEVRRLSPADRQVLDEFRPVPIKFVGLFDTVRAAGLEVLRWFAHRLPPEVPREDRASRGTLALRYTRHLPPNVEQGFHALAVDEHRAVFHPRVWIVPRHREHTPAQRRVEQRWFVGAHANVGGGYRDDSLAPIPLRWIQDRATVAGLRFSAAVQVEPDAHLLPRDRGCSSVRDSYREWGWGTYRRVNWQPYLRPINPPPVEYEYQTIDWTVFDRIVKLRDYRPKNVEAWLREQRWRRNELAPNTADLERFEAALSRFGARSVTNG